MKLAFIQTFLKEGGKWQNDALFLYDAGIFYNYVQETNCMYKKCLDFTRAIHFFKLIYFINFGFQVFVL